MKTLVFSFLVSFSAFAAPCDLTLVPADFNQENSFDTSSLIVGASACGQASMNELMTMCKAENQDCKITQQEENPAKTECSYTVTGKRTLPDTPASHTLLKCRKILDCQDKLLFSSEATSTGAFDENATKELDDLAKKLGCGFEDAFSIATDDSGRENGDEDTSPASSAGPVSGGAGRR